MKEAAGELNITLVVVLAIGALMAFFLGVVWPLIDGELTHDANCDRAICGSEAVDGMVVCHADDNPDITFHCPFKG